MKAVVIYASLLCSALGSPLTAGPRSSPAVEKSLLGRLSRGTNDNSDIETSTARAFDDLVSNLDLAGSIPTADSASSALSAIDDIVSNGSPNILDLARGITKAGLVPPEIISFLNGYLDSGVNSPNKSNPSPNTKIYPSKAAGDAPYSIPEDTLRAAIHIPDSFSFGRTGRIPVILVPGTAIPAGSTYHFNFGKLGDSAPVDPVWVNLPRASLSDVQTNAEYVAYAIHYISTLCAEQEVAVISWSQGGLDTQWALKYWPSTRKVVKDFVPMSPDFHGTVESALICPVLSLVLCTPALYQQGWESEFIHTLRADAGDSAYVPTTTVYSSFDEIVQPMFGPNASAILNDVRDVGVTNVHLQSACTGKPAGGAYTHEGVLYNPLAWAVAIDAITHDGPADLARIDLHKVCQQVLAPELELMDLFGTEGLLLIAVAELLAYQPPTFLEPPIKEYAS